MSTARAVRDAALRANIDVHVRMQSHPTSTIKIDPSLAAEAMRADGSLGASKAGRLPTLKLEGEDASRDDRGKDRRGSNGKILGSNQLWNLLHRYRDVPEDPEAAAQQDKQLELLAAGALGVIALGVVALAWLLF